MNLNTIVRNSHCFNLPDPVFQTASERFTTNLITTVINIPVAPNAIIANVLILVAIINCSSSISFQSINCLFSAVWCFSRLNNPTRIYQLQALGMVLYIVAFYICFGVSCETLTAVSFERFVAVRFPSIYTTFFSRKRVIRHRDMDGEHFTKCSAMG